MLNRHTGEPTQRLEPGVIENIKKREDEKLERSVFAFCNPCERAVNSLATDRSNSDFSRASSLSDAASSEMIRIYLQK